MHAADLCGEGGYGLSYRNVLGVVVCIADKNDDISGVNLAVAVYVERIEIDVVHCLPDRGADSDDDILYVDLTVAVSVAEKSHVIGGNLPLRRTVCEHSFPQSLHS